MYICIHTHIHTHIYTHILLEKIELGKLVSEKKDSGKNEFGKVDFRTRCWKIDLGKNDVGEKIDLEKNSFGKKSIFEKRFRAG